MIVKTSLWKHQQQMVDFALSRLNSDKAITVGSGWNISQINGGMSYWLAGCSTGKTLSIYKVIEMMNYKKVLIVTTKAAAVSAWKKDAEKHLENVNVVTAIGDSKNAKKQALIANNGDTFVYVINYESAWRIAPELIRTGFDLLVLDESHKAKAHNSAQSKGLAEIASYIPHKIAMTGTGFSERITDVYGQVRALQPVRMPRIGWQSEILGKWTDFFEKYVDYFTYEGKKIPKGYKNVDELKEILQPFTLYVDSEVVLDLPNVIDIDYNVPMSNEISTAYQQMSTRFLADLHGGIVVADNILEQAIRLHQITSGYLPNELGEATPIVPDNKNPKLLATLDILDEIGGKPTVIFTRFREDVNTLQRNLEKNGYSTKLLTGTINQQIEWQYDKQGQILIANIQAGGEGVDLTRARYCIYYSIGHSRTSYIQSLARIRRVGADLNFPVTYYNLIMENSIDIDIRNAMLGKATLEQSLLDGVTNRVI